MAVDWTQLAGSGVPFFSIALMTGAVATGTFVARTYISFDFTKRIRLDFWFAAVTFIFCVASQVTFSIAVVHGLGAHIFVLDDGNIVLALAMAWVSQLTAIVATVFGKLSIISFLDQIRGRHRGRPWLLYVVGVSTVIVNLVAMVTLIFQCTPIQKLWNERLPGQCRFQTFNQAYAYFQGSHAAVTDVVLALYPIKLIAGLQLSRRMKVGLSCLMGVGLLAAACAIGKTAMLVNLVQHDDVTFYISRLAFATILEAWIVLLVGCVPPLRPLFAEAAKSIFGATATASRRQITRPYLQQNGLYGRTLVSTHRKSQVGGMIHVEHHPRYDGISTPDSIESAEMRESHMFEERTLKTPEDEVRLGGHNGGIVRTTHVAVSFESGPLKMVKEDDMYSLHT